MYRGPRPRHHRDKSTRRQEQAVQRRGQAGRPVDHQAPEVRADGQASGKRTGLSNRAGGHGGASVKFVMVQDTFASARSSSQKNRVMLIRLPILARRTGRTIAAPAISSRLTCGIGHGGMGGAVPRAYFKTNRIVATFEFRGQLAPPSRPACRVAAVPTRTLIRDRRFGPLDLRDWRRALTHCRGLDCFRIALQHPARRK